MLANLFESALGQNIIPSYPGKSKNPLEIAGFLLFYVQRRAVRFYKIYDVWGLIYAQKPPKLPPHLVAKYS